MTNMEKFNHMLNSSLPDSNSQAREFRLQIDMQLKTLFSQLNKKQKAVIIGAGKMKDFSLNFFVRNFDKVVLTDIDEFNMKEAFMNTRLPNKSREKVFINRIEYTGYEQIGFFDQFKERLITCRSFEKIEQVIKRILEERKTIQFLPNEIADFIYVSPIYTQLVYNQLLRECSILRENGYPEHLIKYLENIMLDEMIDVINEFNDNLIRLLDPSGKMLVLSDVFQVDIGSDFYIRVKNGIKNQEVMDEIYKGYFEKFGMGLGDYGLYNLDEKMESELSKWLIWPFDEKSCFVVKLKIYHKKINKEE